MRLSDLLWEFACGGWCGWLVRGISDRQAARRAAEKCRSRSPEEPVMPSAASNNLSGNDPSRTSS